MSRTEYRIHGLSCDTGEVVVHLLVGNRSKLEPIALSRPEAWTLFRKLAAALEVTE